MIKVTGVILMNAPYEVELDMTVEQFDSLSEKEQNNLIEESVDWMSTMRNAETSDIEVDDVQTMNDLKNREI